MTPIQNYLRGTQHCNDAEAANATTAILIRKVLKKTGRKGFAWQFQVALIQRALEKPFPAKKVRSMLERGLHTHPCCH
jgi:hypothetical protein